MRAPLRIRALLIPALLIGCGPGAASVNGSVYGTELGAEDAVVSAVAPGDGSSFTQVWISSMSDFCLRGSGAPIKDARILTLSLGIVAPDGTVVAANEAGVYQYDPAAFKPGVFKPGDRVATALWANIAVCLLHAEVASGGTVHVTHVASGPDGITEMDGSFELPFGTGSLSGTFRASGCPAVNARVFYCR